MWRKTTFIYLQVTFLYCYLTAWIYSNLKRKSKPEPEAIKRIATVWYWPEDFNADELRLGYWGRYFENDGFAFDNFSVLSQKEFVAEFEEGTWSRIYLFYRKILLRRWRQLFEMNNYDVVWIDRTFLPFYPVKKAFFERCLQRMGLYVVIDSTDGTDYEGNPDLEMDKITQADTLTVGYKKLYEFFKPKVSKIVRINFTVPTDRYVVKDDWDFEEGVPVLGWMGSPTNFAYMKDIEGELQKLAKEINFKMILICRIKQMLDIPGVEIEHHYFGDDYHDLIGRFDIGLAPFTAKSFGTEGKVGMKHQEFLICQIPQVCSSVGISEHAVHDEHVLIAEEIEDWRGTIKRLLNNKELRQKLGKNGRKLFDEHYNYDAWYPALYDALTNFEHVKSQ